MAKSAEAPLINMSDEKALLCREYLKDASDKYGELMAFSDTETTGVEVVDPVSGLFNRVIEWSIVFAYKGGDGLYRAVLDNNGNPVSLDEPINPFVEKQVTAKQKMTVKTIHPEASKKNGLTLEYLFGEADGLCSRPKLNQVAPSFNSVYSTVMAMIDFDSYKSGKTPITMAFHNAPFDIKFLKGETDMLGLEPIESAFPIVDTLEIGSRLFGKKVSLDGIFEFGVERYPEKIKPTERPVHSAIIDSLILMEAYNTMLLYKSEIESTKIY